MNSKQTEQQSIHIGQEKLLAFVRAMIGGSRGREDDEHPLKPGPWDPVIRAALERINVFDPQPNPWNSVLAKILRQHPEMWEVVGGGLGGPGGPSFGEKVTINPQPLPPRIAFLVSVAQAVISRAELLQEIADATRREGEQHGIIFVGGYTSRFSDDWCGNGFRLKWPFTGPRPHWFTNEIDGIDLVVMATQFEQAAKETFSSDLRQNLLDVSAKLAEAGVSKMR
jgi:hypothetical protein